MHVTKHVNPLYNVVRNLTGIKNLTAYQTTVAENGQKIRAAIRKYVEDRISGANKSNVEEGADILSLFLQNRDVFTVDLIVDELLDFFLAGSITTQFASQTNIAHCAKNPESLKRIRDEFEKLMSKHPLAEDGKKSKREVMDAALDTETIADLEYLNRVTLETMRYQSPVMGSTYMEV